MQTKRHGKEFKFYFWNSFSIKSTEIFIYYALKMSVKIGFTVLPKKSKKYFQENHLFSLY